MNDGKYNIKIGDFGFVLTRHTRLLTHLYTRDEAPAFVNKFSSGDPNYRDATFFSTWAQLDWLNGFNQEFFDDPSRFYMSANVDITTLQQLTLEKAFNSTGQLSGLQNVQAEVAWRTPSVTYFGSGGDGALTISSDTTEAPIDSAAAGTAGSNTLTATNAGFAAGQEILIHQTIGTGVGTWQRNKIAGYTAGTITTVTALNASYSSTGSNKAQVRVIPQYTDVTIASTKTYTAKAWDGTVGGILCFLASGTVTVAGTISANGKGFRGGAGHDNRASGTNGEQSAANGGYGATAGGDSAGGGGGNGAVGSNGASGGVGGAVAGNSALTSMVFGGGGGGGCETIDISTMPDGGPGGGIVFIIAETVGITGFIYSKGSAGIVGAGSDSSVGGGGGAGGSILIKAGTATLGTDLIVATGGAGGAGSSKAGGAGGTGRVHLDYRASYSGSTSPTIDVTQDGTLTSTAAGSTYTLMVGDAAGKIYTWDGNVTYTEVFDVNRLEWYETGEDEYRVIGDASDTEYAASQGFQVDEAMYISGVEVYIKRNAGTPGDITVTIETDSTNKPSGTVVTGCTATIPAVASTSYGWITATFATPVALAKTTTYHIVLKTAAAATNVNYKWASDGSSPSYAAGKVSQSTNGGSTWSAVATSAAYFRVRSESVGVTSAIISDISGGSSKLFFGTGNFTGTHVGNARIYSYDGTTWAITKIFTGTTDSSVGSMVQYGTLTPGVFVGVGHKAKIYFTADMSTFTVSKTITEPRNPGFVLTMCEYNGQLVVGGGYPEQLYGSGYQYSGFLYYYDEYQWGLIGTFEHTVITALESFDTMLFVGTIKKRLYVYNTATIDKLFEFPWDVSITALRKWDDKLAIAVAPRPGASSSGHEGVYIFDRNGIHLAFNITSRSWYSLFVFNNNLLAGGDTGYIYQTDFSHYQSTGWMQSSYFEASLPTIDKLYKEITIQHDPLPTGCSIEMFYRFKESDSWVSLGTDNTVGAIEYTFSYAVDIYTKKMSIKYVLTTTDTTVSPTIKKVITKYQIAPDVKYIWKMTIACPDNIKWGDETVPIAKIGTGCTAGDTSLILTSIEGFPDPNGSTQYASIIEADGTVHPFSYTEITVATNTLTGIPATGTYALPTEAAGLYVKVLGRDIHRALLDLKRTKKFYTFTDIDGLTYTVYFSVYQTDNWVIDVDTGSNLIENEVPITLLEA